MTKTTTPEFAGLGLRLFGGKGGVGKTTCAAAFAVAEAKRGARVLVASTDPAHSLGDALAVDHLGGDFSGGHPGGGDSSGGDFSGDVRPVPGVPGLSAVEIDAESAWSRWLAPRKAAIAAIGERGTYFTRDDLAPLLELRLPGVDELLGLLECLRLACDDGADCVVVDAAPTGHTLRLLEMPDSLDAFASVLDAMEERHRALSDAFGAGRFADADRSGADDLIADLRGQAAGLRDLLRDPDRTRISWVLLPEPLAIAETESALGRLSDLGLGVAELVVNRLAPSGDRCAEALGRTRAERRALDEIHCRFPDLPLRRVAESAEEPIGARELLRLTLDEMAPFEAEPGSEPETQPRVQPEHRPRPQAQATGHGLGHTCRLVLVGGKGGVGKSTCAAALAIDLAEDGSGRSVDLVSTDPAPSLSRLFGFTASPREPTWPDSAPPGLRVQELDAAARFSDLRRRLVERLDRVTRQGDERFGGTLPVERSVFESLVAATPPGLDELVALGELAERLDAGPSAPRIVVDMSPTGHALRLLELPDLALTWIRALMKLLLDYRQVFGLGELAEELLALSKSVRGVEELLRDPRRCAFVPVTRAAALPVAETRRLLERLGRLRIAVEAVIVNAVLPPGRGPCEGLRARQERWIQRLTEEDPPRAILLAPIRFPRPEGVQGLREWHEQWTPLET